MPRNAPGTPAPFDPESYRDAAAAAVGLSIPDECMAEVAANIDRAFAFARLLLDRPDLCGEEPAPVFDPRRRGSRKELLP